MTVSTATTRTAAWRGALLAAFRGVGAGWRGPQPRARGPAGGPTPAARPERGPGLVVLWGLPAPYARELREALLGAGHARVTTLERQGPPPTTAPGGGRVTVVVGSGVLEDLDGLDGWAVLGGAAVVEVIAEAGVEAFVAAMGRGASGVLDPGSGLGHAVQVVAAAAAGLVLVTDHVSQALAAGHRTTTAPSVGATERAWLRWLGSGGTVIALAAQTSRSEREMYRLLARLYADLGAGGRTEALLRAERWGLLDD